MHGAGEERAIVDFSVKPVLGEMGEPTFLVAESRGHQRTAGSAGGAPPIQSFATSNVRSRRRWN